MVIMLMVSFCDISYLDIKGFFLERNIQFKHRKDICFIFVTGQWKKRECYRKVVINFPDIFVMNEFEFEWNYPLS